MKKITYAILGALLIVIATLTRTFGHGGLEVLTLLVVGIALLIGSADLPASSKGRIR